MILFSAQTFSKEFKPEGTTNTPLSLQMAAHLGAHARGKAFFFFPPRLVSFFPLHTSLHERSIIAVRLRLLKMPFLSHRFIFFSQKSTFSS